MTYQHRRHQAYTAQQIARHLNTRSCLPICSRSRACYRHKKHRSYQPRNMRMAHPLRRPCQCIRHHLFPTVHLGRREKLKLFELMYEDKLAHALGMESRLRHTSLQSFETQCNGVTRRLITDTACVVYTRDEIPLTVILDHLISCWGLTRVSHQRQDL